tara:strand:+ start:183 stop:1454 length:1272 start_codon:yes stop_codon:yes gene_type:complete
MADKSFGVKELNLLNASGTPTVTSPNNLNLNANTVAISTSATVGNNLTVSGQLDVGSNIKIGNAGVVTATSFVGNGAITINNNGTSKIITGSGTANTLNANVNLTFDGTTLDVRSGNGNVNAGVVTATTFSGNPSNDSPHSLWDVVNNGSSAYRFTGPGQDGAEDNPDIFLVRGQRYVFKMNASGHPFQIRVSNGGSAYSDGVTNNGAQTGNVEINVQHDAPSRLYYQCTSHSSMVGNIFVIGGTRGILVSNTTLSGTSVSYDGIPSWATKITFVFHRLSLDSNSGGVGSQPGVEVRLRQGGSDITSTYTSIAHGFGDNDSNPADFSGTMYVNTDSFGMNFTHAAHWYTGKMEIEKVASTLYQSRFSMLRNTSSSGNLQQQRMGNGELTLSSGTADGITIFCSNTNHNFDSTPYTNKISVYYE